MTANGTLPVPTIVLDIRDDHIRHLQEAPLPYPASFLLVEGHRRFNIAAYLALLLMPRSAKALMLAADYTFANRSTVSGNFSTSRINNAAWAFGFARPCSQFSTVRGLVRR